LETIFPTNHLVDINKPNQTATKLQHKKKHKQQLKITTSVQTKLNPLKLEPGLGTLYIIWPGIRSAHSAAPTANMYTVRQKKLHRFIFAIALSELHLL